MAQSQAKRNQRAKRTSRPAPSAGERPDTTRRRRLVIAFLILLGLAGILAISVPEGDGSGHPTPPESSARPSR